MLIYNLSDKLYDDIVLKQKKSLHKENTIKVIQYYRKNLNLVNMDTIRWKYKTYKDGCVITDCITDTKQVIIIPKELNGLEVLGLDSYALKKTRAEKIISPHTKLILSDYAFAELYHTKEIQLLAGMSMEGVEVFKNSPCTIKFKL